MYEESKVDILTCYHGLHQLINEPNHLLDTSSFCIDFISILNQTLSWSLAFNPLFTQIFTISWYLINLIYPSIIFHLTKEKYGSAIDRANADLIQRAIHLFDRDMALRINDVDKIVAIFSDALMNIMQNFVPDETVICDDLFKRIKLYFISVSLNMPPD